MAENGEDLISNNNKDEIEKQEINLQFHFYLTFFAFIYLGSYFLPGIILMLFILLYFVPYFLQTTNFVSLFIELKPLLALTLMPLIIISCYLIHLFFIGLLTRWFWRFTEKKSPTKNGIIPRNVPSDTLNYYHIRSFVIKYGKYVFTKGLFPWLLNWYYNFVGSNKIGNGTTIEEEIVGDKFIDVGEDCYIGVNSAICSHTVEGTFGRIPYFEIKLGDNVTCTAFNIVGPGCDIQDNSYLLPLGSTGKNQTTKGNNYYFGIPMRKIFTKKIMEYLKISKEDLEKDKELRNRQKKLKEKMESDVLLK